jgi:outer membrane protein TolC
VSEALAEAREQGYREGYARALADVRREIDAAMATLHESDGRYTVALQHVRALVHGLRERARRAR